VAAISGEVHLMHELPNQVENANIAMAQNIGGSGATILTHILVGD
jgi:hypothetical protein